MPVYSNNADSSKQPKPVTKPVAHKPVSQKPTGKKAVAKKPAKGKPAAKPKEEKKITPTPEKEKIEEAGADAS